MADKVQLIKQEIERRVEQCYRVLSQDLLERERNETKCCLQQYKELLQFINSLPEEPASEDLEEAASKYVREDFHERSRADFKAGAEWQKQKMMNDVFIDDYIVHDGRIELEGDPLPSVDPIILLPYPEFKPNDKVKIIIIKE